MQILHFINDEHITNPNQREIPPRNSILSGSCTSNPTPRHPPNGGFTKGQVTRNNNMFWMDNSILLVSSPAQRGVASGLTTLWTVNVSFSYRHTPGACGLNYCSCLRVVGRQQSITACACETYRRGCQTCQSVVTRHHDAALQFQWLSVSANVDADFKLGSRRPLQSKRQSFGSHRSVKFHTQVFRDAILRLSKLSSVNAFSCRSQ